MLRDFDASARTALCTARTPALLAAMLAVVVAGCGIKGPLRPATPPPAPAASPSTEPAPTATEHDPATPRKP